MRRCPNSLIWALILSVIAAGCSDEAAEERREFQKLEAAIGIVANAPPDDRKIRLEQLEAAPVRFERTKKLKALCVSSYRAFERASLLMKSARNSTDVVEARVKEADQKRADGTALTANEEAELVALGKKAATALADMTAELESAERLTAECQESRNHLRFEMAAQ